LLNPDAFPEPGWLGALVEAARKHTEFAMFGSRLILDADHRVLDGIGDVYHVSGLHWREGYLRPVGPDCSRPREIFAPCGAAAMYRRDAFEALGGFDEDFFCYAEDIDLGFRMRLAGHRAMYVPDAVVYHVGSASTGPRSDFSVYHGHRNLVWAYVKNMPRPLFWRYLPYHVLVNLATVAVLARRGQAGVALRAKLDALQGLSPMLAKRRSIQASRKTDTAAILSVMSRGWPERRRLSSTRLL
jgi:GT2 family glycosyltransferase